jgi:hypothetical protein
LQFTNDTLILIESSLQGIVILKPLLLSFENMFGLKINLGKSEAIVVGTTDAEKVRWASLINCKLGSFPFTYLGMPMSDRPLRVSDWEFLTEKVTHRVDPWQGLFLASAGRLELTNLYV